MMSPEPATPIVAPKYCGGPWDGGLGPLEPSTALLGTIRLRGGVYSLHGFEEEEGGDYPVDRAVYLWEVET